MPGQVDSNSPAFWYEGEFRLLNSTGNGPVLSRGADQFHFFDASPVTVTVPQPWPTWIEAVWVDPNGAIFAWYHQEQENVCGAQRPSQPRIGAALSYDGGQSFFDLGIILSSGDGIDCSSQNGYFAGGHGDFTVVPDREGQYFYFFFGNYGGALPTQGVAVARMAFADRFHPAGAVWKYYNGEWREPGVGGRTTPIFPATVSWQDFNTDAFWGPSVHWNTHLERWVMLLNRSCCTTGFPQEGIYLSFGAALSDPVSWSPPVKILDNTGWYPQILGAGEGETDSVAGRQARLYVYGISWWEIFFLHDDEPDPEPVPVVEE